MGVCMPARREARSVTETTALNHRVQGPHCLPVHWGTLLSPMPSTEAELRQLMRQQRRRLSPARQQKNAALVARTVSLHKQFLATCRNVSVYLDFDGELQTGPLLKTLRRRGKRLFVPLIPNKQATSQSRLRFVHLHAGSSLHLNRYGIRQPQNGTAEIPPSQLDLVFLPLTAFDSFGQRLGMGGGYYDRSFAFKRRAPAKRPRLIGVAHECQKVGFGQLRSKSWDVPLDYVVTERGLRKCVNGRR